jgi:uncharacterized membrane protein/mono/diheme cytochrome c family protein
MNRSRLLALAILVYFSPILRAAPSSGEELAVKVHGIFKAQCARCHGSDVTRPSGRFGYVLDLKRLAANPEMIVAGNAEDSELWRLLRDNEMPPRPAKPVSPEDKDAIRAWIRTGAPPLPAGAEQASSGEGRWRVPEVYRRYLGWAGRFHLLVLHFPIAFLFAAAVVEVAASRKRGALPAPSVRFCSWCGAIAAVPAALLGWCYALAGQGAHSGNTLEWHRWTGTATAVWAIATALLVERDARRGKRLSVTQLMVLLAAVLVGLAGYFGGELAHGDILSSW